MTQNFNAGETLPSTSDPAKQTDDALGHTAQPNDLDIAKLVEFFQVLDRWDSEGPHDEVV
jgi:hypothetical protein